jgi:dolichol-phosphate mannosyltransferase
MRNDTAVRRAASWAARLLMRILFGKQTPDALTAFRIMSRRLVDEYLCLSEHHTYVSALIAWIGFPNTSVPVRHDPRLSGRSGYSLRRLMRVWVNIAFGFSERPLTVATWAGCAFSTIAFVVAGRSVYVYFTAATPALGYTSLFASQMLFFGITFIFLGIIGEYVARITREVKRRPRFIVDREGSVPPMSEPVDCDGRVR